MTNDETPKQNDSAPPSTVFSPPPSSRHAAARIGRRELIFGLAVGVPGAALLPRLSNLGDSADQPSGAMQAAPPSPDSELASEGPNATPTAADSAGEMLGKLRVVRDQRPTYEQDPIRGGGIQVMLTAGDNLNFNPAAFRQDFQILASHLDPLVWIDEVTMEPIPWLVEGWQWEDDGEAIIYRLRDNILWHDGDPLTSDDVVFSLTVHRDDVDSAVRNLYTNLESVEVVGERTFRVRLSSPDGNWLRNASSQFIVQRKQYQEHWESRPEGERTLSDYNWRRNAPIGTGPWRVGERGSESIAFSRNDDYWAAPPHLDQQTLSWSTDPVDRLVAWTGGTTDILWPIRPSDVDTASGTTGWLYVADAASVMFAAFNFNNPARRSPELLSDIRLRRALSFAIDRERYAREVFRGFIHADAAGTVAQPWAHDETLTNPPRDVEQARALLAEAGWEDADNDGYVEGDDGNPLVLTCIVQNDQRAELLAVLESIVADLKEVGVSLIIQRLGPDQFRDRWVQSHEFDLIAYAYNLFPGFTDFDLYGS
ncbi:MAG: ABC transporter substrate-binding protein, partial [Thermomicrobiales bacterium]